MDDVLKLVNENPFLEIFNDDSGKEKVKCKLTGHQLQCRSSDIITYTKGKKYQRLLKGMTRNDKTENEKQGSLEEYKQYLVPAEKRKNQLYCKVTKKLINDIPHHIELHVKGKRFQRALKKYEESKSDETPENGEANLNVWEPSDTESTPEPDIDPLPDSFDEDSDNDEDGVDDDDDDDVDVKDNIKKESKSSKTDQQSKKKLHGNKNKNVNNKLPNTRKRNIKDEASEQKETPKKIKKQTKSKTPIRKNLRRKAKI